jgi:putative heme-binding domain-containing protein
VLFFSTLPAGEQRTGVFRSDSFALPERLSFFMAGHNGMPPAPAEPNNVVRLRDAESGAVLQEALPPRDDTAQRIEWDLTPFRGRHAYVEIVDGDTRGAFAWLAVGRFSLDALNPRTFSALDAAIQLVTRLRMTDVAPTLNSFVASPTVSPGMKLRCAEALLGLDPDARLSALLPLAADLASPAELRGRILGCVRSRDAAELQKTLADAMRAASAVQQRQMADALAGSRAGSEALFVLVDSGLAAPRMLTDAALAQKLKAAVGAVAETRIAALTQGLPPVSEELNQLLAERRRSFTTEGTSPGRGRAAFKQHCAACHQLGGEGKKIGPQLDGVGIRGADRLLEDLLDPNRNVDAAFRTSTVLTKDGQVLTGLVQREEGALLVLADNKGEEFRVLKDDIEEQQKSTLSLMPVNLVSALPEAELHELLAYLLQQTAKPGQP